MERSKCSLIALFFLFGFVAWGQSDPTIYRAYIKGDMLTWKVKMDSIEKSKPLTEAELQDLVNYQYGYVAWCLGQKRHDEADIYLSKARKNLESLEKNGYDKSIIYSYKSAFYGFEIGLSPYKAPFIGSKSLESAKNAVKEDELNAFAYFQLGNVAYYTPSLFGGSKTEALLHYLTALRLMETSAIGLQNNWNYLNLLVSLILVNNDLHRYNEALFYCEKTLKVEPEFDWVKNNLYSKTIKKVDNE